MSLEISLFVECFPTVLERADEITQSFMFLEMDFKPPLSAVGCVTAWERAPEHFELLVSFHVIFKVAF
jgi:hypothetical protein